MIHYCVNISPLLIDTSLLIPHIYGQVVVPMIIDTLAELAIAESLGTTNEEIGFLPRTTPNYTAAVLFRLFTRQHSFVGVNLEADPASLIRSPIDPNVPTKIFVFGFENNKNSEPTTDLKNAYLTRGECNFIVVDWSQLACSPNYLRDRGYVVGIANETARLLDVLADSGISLPMDQHIIGHSLGAHIAGLASRSARTIPGRCTGLDPAGPLFELSSSMGRIDSSSATLVDIIHSAAGSWGISTPVGHIDFYPNGGTWPQPDCRGNLTDILVGFCSHLMSLRYFAHTILQPTAYIGNRCQTSTIIRGDCPENTVAAVMGEHIVFESPGLYYVDARLHLNLTVRSKRINT